MSENPDNVVPLIGGAEEKTPAQQLEDAVKRAVELVAPFADSVQVLATYSSPDGEKTETVVHGLGNTYARTGLARNWVERMDEATRLQVRQRMAPPRITVPPIKPAGQTAGAFGRQDGQKAEEKS